jgi:adenylosuccinate lyase
MGHVWSEQNRFQKWLEVELAATETLAEAGIVPRAAAAKLRERAKVDVARINELEAKVRHDVIAFTIAVQESVGDPEAARWLHYGLTSNDVVDTARRLSSSRRNSISSATHWKSGPGNSRTRPKSAGRTAYTPSR